MNKNVSLLVIAFIILFTANTAFSDEKTNSRTRLSSLTADDTNMSDLEAEIMFGRNLAARILGNYKAIRDEKLIRYVNIVGKGLSLYSGRPDLKFHFIPLDSDEINAFATPGGYIFITNGALKAMDNEAQLACVLAHEIAHVTKKHVVKRLNIKGDDASGFSALSTVVGGGTEAVKTVFVKAMDDAAGILFEKGYKLDEEMDADSTGMMIAALTGYDPKELATFLESVRGFEKPDASYKEKQPQYRVRLSSIKATLVQNGMDQKKFAKARSRFHAKLNK